jgi:hypothetical protein
MGVKVTVTSDRSKAVQKAIKTLATDRILIGIPSEKAFRAPEPGETRTLNNAEIGYLQENGAPEINLPARPHLVPGVQRVQEKIIEEYRGAIKAISVASDPKDKVRAIETKIGFMAVASVKSLIADGISPPLAPSTLAERKRRGVSRTTPLQDTGQYRNAIDFVIRPAGGVKRKK